MLTIEEKEFFSSFCNAVDVGAIGKAKVMLKHLNLWGIPEARKDLINYRATNILHFSRSRCIAEQKCCHPLYQLIPLIENHKIVQDSDVLICGFKDGSKLKVRITGDRPTQVEERMIIDPPRRWARVAFSKN